MKNNSSREHILNKIAEAEKVSASILTGNTEFVNEEIFYQLGTDKVDTFKTELEAVSGHCFVVKAESEQFNKVKEYLSELKIDSIFCRDIEICEKLKKHGIPYSSDENQFNDMKVGITGCEALVARTGSVLVSSAGVSGRQMNVFPPVHIVLAKQSDMVDFPEDAILKMQNKYGNDLPSAVTFVTGPSRTADIEKTLVLGAHGPKDFSVFLLLN